MLESAYTFLAIYTTWVVAGALLQRFAPRLLDRIGDRLAR